MTSNRNVLEHIGPVLEDREFLGHRFAAFRPDTLLAFVRAGMDRMEFGFIVTPNTDHIVQQAKLDGSELGLRVRDAYQQADLRICDSRILARLASLSGIELDVLPGSDLTRLLFETGTIRAGDRVGMIGGDQTQLAWLRAYRPDIEFVAHFPPMGVLHDDEAQERIIAFVEQAECALYFLCLGAPQSEIIAAAVKARGIARGIALCVGASIEFLSGTKRRAPRWVQRVSLEWAYRLASEPKRLWRRYLIDGPRIFVLWQRHHGSTRKPRRRPG